MNEQTSRTLRMVLLVFGAFWTVYGLLHVISPELMLAKDPPVERVLGASVVALAVAGWLAYRERVWARARLLVLVLILWMILYTASMTWGLLAGGIPAAAWPPTILGAAFAVLLGVLYSRE